MKIERVFNEVYKKAYTKGCEIAKERGYEGERIIVYAEAYAEEYVKGYEEGRKMEKDKIISKCKALGIPTDFIV